MHHTVCYITVSKSVYTLKANCRSERHVQLSSDSVLKPVSIPVPNFSLLTKRPCSFPCLFIVRLKRFPCYGFDKLFAENSTGKISVVFRLKTSAIKITE